MKQYFKVNYSNDNGNDRAIYVAIIGIDDMPAEYRSAKQLKSKIAKFLTKEVGADNPFVFGILPLGSNVEFINI